MSCGLCAQPNHNFRTCTSLTINVLIHKMDIAVTNYYLTRNARLFFHFLNSLTVMELKIIITRYEGIHCKLNYNCLKIPYNNRLKKDVIMGILNEVIHQILYDNRKVQMSYYDQRNSNNSNNPNFMRLEIRRAPCYYNYNDFQVNGGAASPPSSTIPVQTPAPASTIPVQTPAPASRLLTVAPVTRQIREPSTVSDIVWLEQNRQNRQNQQIQQIQQMRQIIMNPFAVLISSPPTAIVRPVIDKVYEKKTHTNEDDCPICYESLKCKSIVVTECNHEYCNGCFSNLENSCTVGKVKCPLCRAEIKKITFIEWDANM